ncbi:QcrA and Rieske domain-containing protein [Dyadobacter sediminis]|uniref:Rieske (2Fe-2S) protein n=1 Tax=Dyadobacter sediminis TaxID=1493691 RepID=A0A5R9K6U3_9BACT|nr:Rieske (2Fe-2S) protein [Dyadobacter sediminis]TLU89515.1 Rieske (2Fe-2S) protein [Dyadobacter sediminis]GGC04734.1 iron-sulfur protein [Dyadobacter sediminis]
MKASKEEGMKRGEFLKSLGLSTSALMAFYCLGTTMTACGSSTDPQLEPEPGSGTGLSGTTTGNAVNFTVDLTHTSYSSLKTAGNYKIIGDVLVAFSNASSYAALSKICTHQGAEVQYRKDQNDIYCPSHTSEFTLTGAVKKDPATTPLKAYKTTLSADGNTLTVTA